MVRLEERHFIGRGKDRTCYRHPEDSGKCIKITHPPRALANGSLRKKGPLRRVNREVSYYLLLKRRGYDFQCVARYYGEIDTDKGKGHVYELLLNDDGSVAVELESLVDSKSISEQELDSGLEALYSNLFENAVPLGELHMGNICIQRLSDGRCCFKLVDGIGNSDAIKICDFSKFFMRRKLFRKFTKALNRLAKHDLNIPARWLKS